MTVATSEDLAGIALFESLEPEARAAIAPWFELQDVSPGVNLTGEGAAGYSFFILRDGAATVSIDGDQVRTLGAGDFFGELALLVDDGARVARVRAMTPVRCVSIPREDFLELVETEPAFALHLLRELARRLVEARATA